MCWYCGAPVTAAEPIGRSLRCETCGRDIRSCVHCRFYRPEASVYCREPQAAAELPRERERANFCDWFSLDSKFRSPGAGQKPEKDLAARAAFDNLFSPHG